MTQQDRNLLANERYNKDFALYYISKKNRYQYIRLLPPPKE